MSKIFRFPYTIGLHNTDAAGIIFYGHFMSICHVAFEAFLEEIGYSMELLFARRTLSLPIVHMEADFLKPLTVGVKVEIRLKVAAIGASSYRMAFEIYNKNGDLCITAATVQVCIDPKTGKKIVMPAEFKQALQPYL